MFHTFQSTTASEALPASHADQRRPRRKAIRNACNDCRRRKIKCDGRMPCNQCRWYKQIHLCAYTAPAQRKASPKKSLRELQSQLSQYHAVFARLFPGRDVDELLSQPRRELLHLISSPLAYADPPDGPPSAGAASHPGHELSSGDESDELKSLEEAPAHQLQTNEAQPHAHPVNLVSDDVNSLSLRIDKPSSYVGVSSISTAFKVIFRITPQVRDYILQSFVETAPPTRANTPPPQVEDSDPYGVPPSGHAQSLIESYFSRVHILMPMIDESLFRNIFTGGHRQDPAWLALLNMVFALGSLAGSSCDNDEHYIYFQRAEMHMGLESFGSGSLFMLQAMGLLSGYYLHWLNRPNEANSLLGATIRMATALGLHREYHKGRSKSTVEDSEISADIRRRTWWSLFCLDVWASTSTGRPSLGRTGPGVTVNSPRVSLLANGAEDKVPLKLLPLIHNVEFCKLANRILDTLASRLLPRYEEVFALDAQLIEWHDSLPSLLRIGASEVRSGECEFSPRVGREQFATETEVLRTPRAIMLWRYQNLRMLMYRPFLLSVTLQKTDYSEMTKDEEIATDRCRLIAGETIAFIDATCEHELIAGWNAVWMMYQAVMVPLLSLFSQASPARAHGNHSTTVSEDITKWRSQIETALAFFSRMRDSSAAAEKSQDVVERLFAASKHLQETHSHQQHSEYPFANTDPQLRIDGDFANPSTYRNLTDSAMGAEQTMAESTPIDQLHLVDSNGMDMLWDDMLWDTWGYPTDWAQGLDQLDWDPWTSSIQSYGNQAFR